MKAYKGFETDMKCRGFQYEVGKTYEHDGEVGICASGFHACELPLDCFSYYPPGRSLFAIVECSADQRMDGDSKLCSKSLSVSKVVDLGTLIRESVSVAAATAGSYAHSATAGDAAHSATAGSYAHSATAGDAAHSATAGDAAHSATAGDYAHSATAGSNAIACAIGRHGKAKAATGGWIVLAAYDQGNVKCAKTFLVDGATVKADQWYELDKDGELIEVKY